MGIQERKKREKEKRRQQILSAAKSLFAKRGFHQTTMEEIANEAELSPGTLYLYFKSKDELFAELSLNIIRYLIMRLENLLAEEDAAAEQRLAAVKDILQDVCTFDSFILVNTLRLQSDDTLKKLSPRLFSDLQKQVRKVSGCLSEIFTTGIHNGAFIDKHPELFTGILWAVFSGSVLLNEIQGSFTSRPNNLNLILENAFEIFSRGIRKAPPGPV
jgi:AcrR family transcriptional regulator